MALKTWEPTGAPLKFGRLWMWTMGAEPANQNKAISTTKDTGCTDLCILINNPPSQQSTFGINPNMSDLVEFTQKAQAQGLAVHWSTWIDPQASYVEAAAKALIAPMEAHKVASLCLDLEGEWRKRISNHMEFVTGTLAPAFEKCRTPIGVSSFAALPKEVEPALAWALKYHDGYGAPQSYSVWQGKAWQQSASVQPDKLPGIAADKWKPICGDRIQMILAAYGQPMPGRYFGAGGWGGKPWGVAESLSASLERTQYEGLSEAGFWVEEALSKSSDAAKARRDVIRSVDVTGKSFLKGRRWWPWALGGAGVVAYATRKHWAPAIGRLVGRGSK